MENYRTMKRHYCWESRRKAEGLTISQFAAILGIPVEIYSDAEKGMYDQVTYGKITRGITNHNHSFGERSEKYYRIRMKQAVYELKYVETEEELSRIMEHLKSHKQRLEKIKNLYQWH